MKLLRRLKKIEEFNIIIKIRARKMLRRHQKFLAKVSVKAAQRLREEFAEGLKNILNNPYGYPHFDERKTYRKYLFYKRYFIIYLVEKSTIYIDYIVDTRQNYFQSIN